ncbi:MAG TPA: hypothetical protein VNA20_17500 [Frankiaceae bacterium]|nr:hypothetical protein [Frankiaceae bacterium]
MTSSRSANSVAYRWNDLFSSYRVSSRRTSVWIAGRSARAAASDAASYNARRSSP